MTRDTPVGILPDHQIAELFAAGAITATAPLDADHAREEAEQAGEIERDGDIAAFGDDEPHGVHI